MTLVLVIPVSWPHHRHCLLILSLLPQVGANLLRDARLQGQILLTSLYLAHCNLEPVMLTGPHR